MSWQGLVEGCEHHLCMCIETRNQVLVVEGDMHHAQVCHNGGVQLLNTLSHLLAFSLSWCAYLLHILVLLCHLLLCVAVVTCMALDASGCHLITGSRDLTCAIWGFSKDPKSFEHPLQTLYGHDDEVRAQCMN